MKKLFLMLTAVASMMTLTAQPSAVQRTAGKTAGAVKQLNLTGHSLKKAQTIKLLAEGAETAPANAVEVPFTHDLGKGGVDINKNYTCVNVDNDGRTWKYGTVTGYAACMPPADIDVNNDWLFTVPIHLTPGRYIVKYQVGLMGTSTGSGDLAVYMGTSPSVESMNTVVCPTIQFTSKDFVDQEYGVKVSEEGYYYLGFHCTTAKGGYTVKLANLGMDIDPTVVPDNAIDVPFSHDLGKGNEAVTDLYTVIDANNDTRTWKPAAMSGYTPCMLPNTDDVQTSDDWFITPPVYMAAGDYIVSFNLGYMLGTGIEMGVALGTAPTAEAMTITVMSPTKITVKDMTDYEKGVTIDKAGYYYLGFHATTDKALKSTIKLGKAGIKAGTAEPPVVVDPPVAGTLTYELAPKGELKATLTYTAPTKGQSGADLETITKVELTSRWGVDIYTFTDVTPGQVIVQEVPLYAGINNRFTGVAYVGDVAGEMVEYKSIFAGPDTPLAPTNVKLTPSADFRSATLSWDPVGDVGEQGGYVDTENITYYIFDAFGNYWDPALAETTHTSIVIEYPDLVGQDFFAYQVTAGVGDLYSYDTASNISIIGEPAALPFTESFTDGLYDGIWLSESSQTQQNYGTITDDFFASLADPDDPDAPKAIKAQDGDKGFYLWLPYDNQAYYGLISLRADLSKAPAPVLEFWYQGMGNLIEVLGGTDLDNLKVINTIDLKANPTEDWTQARIALDAFKDAGAMLFEIRFVARDNDDEHTWSVLLDNIRLRNLDPVDMHVKTLGGAGKAKVGDTVTFSASVENIGTEAVTPAVVWEVNGKTYEVADVQAIAANAFADYAFEYTIPYNAPESIEVVFKATVDGDATPADNVKASSVAVTRAAFATITDLQATVNGTNVHLSWSAPVNESADPEVVTETFESEEYTPFSITGVGDWTVYDGDGKKTYNVFSENYNPYQTQPMAFQLFDPEMADISSYYAEGSEAYSGKRYMMAPSAQDALNENYLISPALSGSAQTVTFYAKSYIVTWGETFSVYYSTTDNAPSSFTNKVDVTGTLTDDGLVPEEWTLYSVVLPEGAKYFAIVHDQYDSLALMVDDITYEPAPSMPADLELDHYKVYCNNELVAEPKHPETTFVHAPFDGGDHAEGDYAFEYAVVPVYNHGAVAQSNSVTVNLRKSGIATIEANAISTDADIYTLTGVKVAAANVTPGLYIIKTTGAVRKVLVK